MSQYNKTVLTNAGLELAKRANAGQARFEITRAVTSADDWSNKTIQDIEAVTAIPNIMQQGTIMDTEEVESNNSVMGVSLCFTNKNLSAGYQIKIIGVYVKEEGQENDFLYAVTTAVTPEHMPDFSDEVLYRFNMQLYLVIGKAQAVNVVINDGASVTHKQFDNYKSEVTASLEKIENAHKEDMSHVVKSASINGGDEILPDEAGKLELVVPDPDLSKYVSLEQLAETLKTKADITAIPDKTATEEGIRQAKQMAQEADTKAQNALDNKADKTTVEENLATKANQSDLDKTNAEVAKKANSEDVSTDISNLQNQINSKTTGTIITDYDIASKTPTKKTDRYNNKWLVDQNVLGQFADQINQLKGRRTVDAQDFNNLTDTGTYYVSNPGANKPTGSWGNLFVSNGDGHRTSQLYFPDDNSAPWYRTLDEGTWHDWTQLASAGQVTNAQNTATQANNNANGRLSLGGGNMTLRSKINWNGGNIDDRTGNLGGLNWSGGSDWAQIYGDQDGNDNLDLAFDLGDDGSNHFSFRSNGSEVAAILANGQINSPTIQDLYNKLAQYTVDYNNNYVHDTTIDFNSYLHETRTIKVANVKANNGPLANTATIWGWLTTYHWDDNSVTQEYRDAGGEVFWRATSASASRQWTWHKYAKQEDIDNQQRQINDLINNINYIKDNYVEGRRFPASQEAQAEAWENEKPTRLAIIEK